MKTFNYGNPDAAVILFQAVDDHDLDFLDNEYQAIRNLSGKDFGLVAVKVEDWNSDLSPWKAPAVFGNHDFGEGAADTLKELLSLCSDKSKKYIIGGYSLAGLFALWSVYQTDTFVGVAAASPSIWFPNFVDYMREHKPLCSSVFLSLGDREEKTRNPVMAKVANCIRDGYEILKSQGVNSILEWNQGNHFKEPDLRTARAFSWVMNGDFS